MREQPNLAIDTIVACLTGRYGLDIASVAFLPLGYDFNAAVYRVTTGDGTPYFLKLRFGPVNEAALLVPRVLTDLGVPNVLAPLRTRSADLWSPLAGASAVLYPFIEGENVAVAGLTDDQWREFGATLLAVHTSGLGDQFRDQLPVETFSLPSAALVRRVLGETDAAVVGGMVAARFAAFWRANAGSIRALLARAEALSARLRATPFEFVLCHADIHAANILAGVDGRIWLVDWDGPIIAPRERDLLFVVGSTIARPVTPREEDLFFEEYGPAEVNPVALAYYRYERMIEDIGEAGRRVLFDPDVGEEARAEDAALAMDFFAPGGMVERAETVTRQRWPDPSPYCAGTTNGDHPRS